MASLMANHDIALTSAGSITWELVFMGLPAVLIVVAENQEGIASSVTEAGAVRSLGWVHRWGAALLKDCIVPLFRDRTLRDSMSTAGRALVDGRGTHRVVEEMVGVTV